jgi:hypothetical protein
VSATPTDFKLVIDFAPQAKQNDIKQLFTTRKRAKTNFFHLKFFFLQVGSNFVLKCCTFK